jgi:exonuclease 1
LTYLFQEKIIDIVITEDSDLLAFGCKKVFYKMDNDGNGKILFIFILNRKRNKSSKSQE